MTERKPIRSEEELAEAFDQLFDEIPSPQTQEEIDEYIREAGIDPDEFGARIKKLTIKALAESPINWRIRSKAEIEEARAQLDSIGAIANKERNNLLSIIDKALEQILVTNPQLISLHHRNRTELSDEDLLSLLQELMFIAERSNIHLDLGE